MFATSSLCPRRDGSRASRTRSGAAGLLCSIAVLLSALTAGALVGACSSEITDDDIDKWTRNEVGFRRLGELMADEGASIEIKTRALARVVEVGQAGRLRSLYDRIPAPEPVAKEVVEVLLGRLGGDEQASVRTKDGLMLSLRYLDEDGRERVRQKVGEWAFGGLTDQSATAQIKKQIEHRILPAQIEELGRHGTHGAALLLSRGFAIDKMFSFLLSFEDPEVDRQALQALIRLQNIPEVQLTPAHLERVARIRTADAAVYLLRVYDTAEDRDLAADAFNRALALLDEPSVQQERARLEPALAAYLAGKNPDDRWFAATYTVRLGGAKAVGSVLSRLRDDGVYDTGQTTALQAALGFCEAAVVPLGAASLGDLHEVAEKGTRIGRATAVLCLKALADPQSAAVLDRLASDGTDVSEVTGEGGTIGKLAHNAAAGAQYLRELDAARKAGSVSAEDYDKRRAIALLYVEGGKEGFAAEVERRAKR